MNEFIRCRRDCLLGIKAYQNILTSEKAMTRLSNLVGSSDDLNISSMFYMGVIRYATPFENTRTSTGDICYPLKRLKHGPEFSVAIHKHLISLRRRLIAHDDLTEIEPRIVASSVGHEGVSDRLITSMAISNKCLGYPVDFNSVEKIRNHVSAALKGGRFQVPSATGE